MGEGEEDNQSICLKMENIFRQFRTSEDCCT